MKIGRFFALCITLSFFICGPCFAAPSSFIKRRVLADLDTIHHIFEVKYAPMKWKGEFANWNLDQAIEEAKNKIQSLSNPTLKECQVVIRDFFNSTRDYHVGIVFYSTESASLPFIVKGAENRYFICEIDRDQICKTKFPFEVGDEILTFDDKPIHDVIDSLRMKEFGDNTYETDLGLAEMALTNRHGAMGHFIPKGSVKITGRKQGEQHVSSVALQWDYFPEKIRDLSKISPKMSCEVFENQHLDFLSTLKQSQFFEKMMLFPYWKECGPRFGSGMSGHALGARSSFLPPLGKKIWKTNSNWIFNAYIFETDAGKKIGYIRIPHFNCDTEEVEEFGEIMNYFQLRTDALVIDQVNNPGGSLFYLYSLVSILADKPFFVPKHHIALTQYEVHTALYLLPFLEQARDDETARAVLGNDMGGYPVDFEFVRVMKQFCNFLIDQWNKGKLYSDPTHLYGWDKIKPHPKYRYSKPVLLLVNSLDFSGGDFFPAILQDNKRALIMGTRTSGAGGYVLNATFPNHSGIKEFIMTGSLAKRSDQKPIENLGVKPDFFYSLTVEDIQGNYQPYVNAIIDKVEELIGSRL